MRPIHAVSKPDEEAVLLGLWLLAEAMMKEFGERFGSSVSLSVRGQNTSFGDRSNWLVVNETGTDSFPVIPDDMREKCSALCEGLWMCAKAHFQDHELDRLNFCACGSVLAAFCFKIGSGGVPEKYLVLQP